MSLLPRFFSLFVLALTAIPFVGWLVLICADFLSLDDCLSPQPGWTAFALITSLSLTLPPVLHGWPDETRPLRDIVKETARAMLFSFALFAIVFLAGARPFFQWLGMPDLMRPMTALFLAPLLSCPLLYVSYKTAVALLPRPGPSLPRPRAVQAFGVLSLIFLVLLIFHAFLLPGESPAPLIHTGRQSLIAAAWRFFALRHVLLVCGNAGFVPAWGGCCLVSVLEILRALPGAGIADLAVLAALFALMTASCACLLLPSSRRWLR